MKKIIVFLFILTTLFLLNLEESIVIPKDSIRYRIIASSNSKEDQALKWQINSAIAPELLKIMDSSSLQETRNNIQNALPHINQTVGKYTSSYRISYGQNYFPQKKYKKVSYPEGNYESLVISLGDGLGENWWCVVFPPLCLMEAKSNDISDVEYKSYIKTIINKYF